MQRRWGRTHHTSEHPAAHTANAQHSLHSLLRRWKVCCKRKSMEDDGGLKMKDVIMITSIHRFKDMLPYTMTRGPLQDIHCRERCVRAATVQDNPSHFSRLFLCFISSPGLVCNRTFDNYACWPDGLPNTTVSVPCPWYLPWHHEGKRHVGE